MVDSEMPLTDPLIVTSGELPTAQTLDRCFLLQHLLPEGLIVEAEKVLCSLVCFSTDRCIRTQFIEACIENLANNR